MWQLWLRQPMWMSMSSEGVRAGAGGADDTTQVQQIPLICRVGSRVVTMAA